MREQYRKTFAGVQLITVVVTAWVYFGKTHSLTATAMVFATMQIGAVLGAAWAARLRRKILRYQAMAR